MAFRVTASFTKPADKFWMSDVNPSLRQQIDAAIATCAMAQGFISRDVTATETTLAVVTLCATEADYDAYAALKAAAIAEFADARAAHLAANNIVENPEVRETI